MIIHVVKNGDSIYNIAKAYSTTPQKLIADNALNNPNDLVIGEALIINTTTSDYYIKAGDSLYTIANRLGTTVNKLLALNPNIVPPYNLYIGQKINIGNGSEIRTPIKVNGYAYSTSDLNAVEKSLPYLTYLSIFSYSIDDNGNLIDINDEPLISLAKNNGVAPIMVVTNTNKNGTFSTELASEIFTNEIVENRLIKDIVTKLRDKGYRGLNIDFEYLSREERDDYIEFITTLHDRLQIEGDYLLSVALAPKTSSTQEGILYEAHDYNALGKEVDYTILMTYEWGYTYSPAMPVAPINSVEKVIDYAKTEIPDEKIFMGIPNYGYDFTVPFEEGKPAKTILNNSAVDYARSKNAAIQYDTKAQTPFFVYYDNMKKEHMVYFEDPRSIKAKAHLVKDKNLGGISIWTISSFYKQLYEVLNNYFIIEKDI